MRVAVLTGSELRHEFVRKAIALTDGIEVTITICEGLERSLYQMGENLGDAGTSIRRHAVQRRVAEEDFFGLYCRNVEDRSQPHAVPKGEVNDSSVIAKIEASKPDIIAAFGCSLIKGRLLESFEGRIANVHLGLSPYYRGSGTNVWPVIQGEPEYVGATFMYLDAGVDTGEIIHQMRAPMHYGDSPHQYGNRLIREMVPVYTQILRSFDSLKPVQQPSLGNRQEVVCRQKDFDQDAVNRLYEQIHAGVIDRFLNEHDERCLRAPIAKNPMIPSQ